MAITLYNWLKDSGTVSSSFDSWVAAQGSNPRSLSIGSDITITGNLTLPSNIDIVTVTNEAKFIGAGKTLTINKMTAHPRHQIFDDGLEVVFTPGAVSYTLPEWFGSGNGNISFSSGTAVPLSRVYVDGGLAVGTNVTAGHGNLYVAGSGAFVGNVDAATPTSNNNLTTKLYVDTASGALNTYITNASGQLSTRINNSGAYAATISGQLNTYITNTSGQLNTYITNVSGQLNTNKVPYSGATANVDLGEYKLSVSNIQFDTSPSGLTNADGLLRWNSTDGTLDLGMAGGDVTMQIGQEMFIKARNISGATIVNATPVYCSGRTGDRPNIWLAVSNTESKCHVIGITTQDITSPADGYVTTFGYVRNIKTNYIGPGAWGTTWAAGDSLYVSKTVSGQLTNIEPDPPHHSDIVGTVEVVHSNLGSILVSIQKHKTLQELTDVDGPNLTTSGQILVWNQASGYFELYDNINNYALKTYVNTASGSLNTYITNTSGQLSNRINNISGVVGPGTSGYMAKYITSSGVGNSIIYESGNLIGISTTKPTSLLSVSGDIAASGYVLSGKNIITNNIGGKSHYLWTYPTSDGTLKVTNYSGTVDLVTITNSGNVGIGTSSPSGKLDVQGTTGSQFIIRRDISPTQLLNISAGGGSTTFESVEGTNVVYPTFNFIATKGATQASRLYIDANGNVGIGLTSFTEKLSVNGNIGLYNAGTQYGALSADASWVSLNGGAGIPIRLVGTGANAPIVFSTGTPTSVEVARITATGYLGIGTSSPNAKLSLGNASDAIKFLLYDNNSNIKSGMGIQTNETRLFFPSSANNFYSIGTISEADGSTYSEKMRVTTAGNVGIGATNPLSKLQINNGAASTAVTIGSESVGDASLILDAANGDAVGSDYFIITAKRSGNYLGLGYVTPDDLVILSNGNVGVGGVTTPDTTLHLKAAAAARITFERTNSARKWYFGTDDSPAVLRILDVTAGITRLSINDAGNIGIGSDTANEKLDVHGDPGVDGSLYSVMRVNNNTTAYSSAPKVGIGFLVKYNTAGGLAMLGGVTAGKENTTDTNYASYLALHTRAHGGAITERMRISSGGDVTIGTLTAGIVQASSTGTLSTAAGYTGTITFVE